MSRFFFHVVGRTMEMDELGTELPSADHAKVEGIRLAGGLLEEGVLERHGGAFALDIMDETGSVLFHLDVTSWTAPVPEVA